MTEASVSPVDEVGAAPLRVLLVEDDPGDAFLVEELLYEERHNFELTWVASVRQAAAACAQGVDCAIVDLGLPEATGLEALRLVMQSCPRTAIVVLSGQRDRTLALAAVSAGAQDYLIKGEVDGPLLARTLRYAIERRRAEQAALDLAEASMRQRHNERIALGLLPRPRIHDQALEIATRYEPAESGEVLGGDFLDVVELPDGTVRMVIGDVAGHGPDEAAIGVNLRIAWRALTLAQLPPAAVLERLHDMLVVDIDVEHLFVTLADVTLDPARDRMAVRYAGHPSLVLLNDRGAVEIDGPRGPALGLTIEHAPPVIDVHLPPRWGLLGYTDGLIESRTGPHYDRWGHAGVVSAMTEALHRPPADVVNGLVSDAVRLNGGPLPDDVALLYVTYGRRG